LKSYSVITELVSRKISHVKDFLWRQNTGVLVTENCHQKKAVEKPLFTFCTWHKAATTMNGVEGQNNVAVTSAMAKPVGNFHCVLIISE
jgi:hypothetical protein